MATSTIVGRLSAIAFGLLFTAIAAWILLWDVQTLNDLTTDHVQSITALLVAVVTGHFCVVCLRLRSWWVLAFALAWSAATFYCIMGSAGRGAEVAERRSADAARSNDARKDARDELAKARTKRDALTDQFIRECGSGRAGRCNGLKFALDSADSHIAILQVRADNAAPEQTANIKLKHAARLLAFFGGVDQRVAEQAFELLFPVVGPLVTELAAIGCLGFGLGHQQSFPQPFRPRLPRISALLVRISRKRRKPLMITGNGRKSIEILPPISDLEIVMGALSKARGPVSNLELAKLMGCSPGEASKRVDGLSSNRVSKERMGRCVLISVKDG